MKLSGLLKFKVLKWPIINTLDGAEAVIFENNSKIISLSKACHSLRHMPIYRGRTERVKICYKNEAQFDLPGKASI